MIALVCFKAGSPGDPGTSQGTQERAETARPWAGAVLLSWVGLLGPRGAPGKRAVLQRHSSAQEQLLCTAQQGWGHCLQGTRVAERSEGDVKGSVEGGC